MSTRLMLEWRGGGDKELLAQFIDFNYVVQINLFISECDTKNNSYYSKLLQTYGTEDDVSGMFPDYQIGFPISIITVV